MRIRWMIIAVSSALLGAGLLGTMGGAAAQRAIPVTPIPTPVPTPVLPNINPTPLTPGLPLTPSLPITPAPNLLPSAPALVPVGLCGGANPPARCTEKSLPESGGDDSSFSDLCEATPRPAWCEDPAKPTLSTNN
jgi:hypothetical protein